MYRKGTIWKGRKKKKAQLSVPADICKRFSVLLLNCCSQAILMSGCCFKEQSRLYLNQARARICAPRLSVSFDGEARNCPNPDGLKYSPCGPSSPWLPGFIQQPSPFEEHHSCDMVEVISGLSCKVYLCHLCLWLCGDRSDSPSSWLTLSVCSILPRLPSISHHW